MNNPDSPAKVFQVFSGTPSKKPRIAVETTLPITSLNGAVRAICANCRNSYEPAPPRSTRERRLHGSGRYICDPCVRSLTDFMLDNMDEDGYPIVPLMVTHVASDEWIREIRAAASKRLYA